MNWTTSAALPSSALALVSMFHLSLGLLRKHRNRNRSWAHPAALASFGLVALPWILPAPETVAIAAGANAVWFLLSEIARARRAPAPDARARAVGRPAPASAADFVATPVLAVFDETSDIRTFRLARPEGFDFAAGQFLTVAVAVDGRKVTRCYSISSAPESTGYIEISVKRQGTVSGLLHATLRAGSLLSVRRPAGRFVYPAGDARPLVLLAGGVGCTPLISMLRHAVACEPQRPVTYVFSGRTPEDIAFRQELGSLARRHPQIEIAIALTRGESAGPGFHRGRIGEELIRRLVPEPAGAIFCICGPTAMIDDLKVLLRKMGVPPDQIRFEVFGGAAATPVTTQAIAAARARREGGAPSTGPRKGECALSLARSGRTVVVRRGQTLLEAAESADAEIPSSCRAGICGTCRTRLIEGDVDCDADALDAADREKGYVLPCVAFPRGDCALEA